MNYIEIFKENDLYGGASRYDYDGIGEISPSTLRYVKVLSDLQRHFGRLDDFDICEIGIGYGGQCRIICSMFKVRSYTLIDLPPVLGLAKAYLNYFPLNTQVKFKTINELDSKKMYDLFVSNYAFSELKRSIQQNYYEKTIKNSENGYITYNSPAFSADFQEQMNFFTTEDYKRLIPNLEVLSEEPLTGKTNRIFIWKKD